MKFYPTILLISISCSTACDSFVSQCKYHHISVDELSEKINNMPSDKGLAWYYVGTYEGKHYFTLQRKQVAGFFEPTIKGCYSVDSDQIIVNNVQWLESVDSDELTGDLVSRPAFIAYADGGRKHVYDLEFGVPDSESDIVYLQERRGLGADLNSD